MPYFCLKISADKHSEHMSMCYGSIQIGEFQEKFEMDLSFWSADQYVNHWKESILRLIEGKEKSCLLTSLSDPRKANFFYWWPMYRDKSKVFIQNGVLFLDEAHNSFRLENIYQNIPEREIISENGEPISEWEVSVDALREYVSLIT